MNPPQVYMCSPSWTLLPSLSAYYPSGSSQCTSPKHPVSCIEPGLATRFRHDILHVSMPFSQIFPPSPSPTESIRLFYTSVSLLLSCTQGYCYHLSKLTIRPTFFFFKLKCSWLTVFQVYSKVIQLHICIYYFPDYFPLFSSVQLLSHVRLFATPWIATCQASLSITNSQSSFKLMSIESVMPSSHLILYRPLLLLPPIPSSIRVFFWWVNSLHEVAKVLEFQL